MYKTEEQTFIKDLGNGLILRTATPADTEALVAFDTRIHSDDPEKPNDRIGWWVRDLMAKPHPTTGPGDFTIVEDTATGKIVSSLNLIPQTWTYAGIPFNVGRPELVGTDPEYRNRGLVREQFDLIHRWCEERGYPVQAITGIPYYYRLFGYEMCLSLHAGRVGYLPHVPKLKEGESEPYLVRAVTEDDIDFLDELYRLGCKRSLVSGLFSKDLWRYEISGKSPQNINREELRIITTPQGERIGLLAHQLFRWGNLLAAHWYDLKPGYSWAAVTPSVIRYIWRVGQEMVDPYNEEPHSAFGFWCGTAHPVYEVLLDELPRAPRPYAYYVRVPDVAGFLRLIQPELERRLANSPFVGHTGSLKLTFYRSGLHLVLENGRFTAIEPWKPEPQGHSGDAAFPDLTFLRLIFGYNTLQELKTVFADCWTDSVRTHALLNAIFPKLPSDIWPVS